MDIKLHWDQNSSLYDCFNKWLCESSLSRLHSHFSKHNAGAITAYRGEFSKSENQERNKKLLAYLSKKGYSITSVKGSYIENFGTNTQREVGEHSFIVVNNKIDGDDKGQLETDLIKLGRLFDQDSILSIRNGEGTLIGTSRRDNAFPSYGKKENVGKSKFGGAVGEFFSRINGRKFAFESIDDVHAPDNINGIRGRDILAEKVENELEKAE